MLNRLTTWAKTQTESDRLRRKILANPYYRFRSIPEVHLAAKLGVRIDVNKAGLDDWLRLPGLSIHQARLLVQLNQGGVQFYAVEDLAAALGLPIQRLHPLTPVLQFCFYDTESIHTPQRVNPNQASVEQLLKISVIAPSLAQQIVRDRVTKGPYRNWVDFQQRLSLPSSIITRLLHHLHF